MAMLFHTQVDDCNIINDGNARGENPKSSVEVDSDK